MTPQCSISKRQCIPPAAWDAIRPRFTALYLVERRTLPQIMNILAEEGFHGTVKQYKDRIRKWNLHKNVKSSLKDKILDELLASTSFKLPHDSNYSLGGVSIPGHKLVRHAKTKNIQLPPQLLGATGLDGVRTIAPGGDISYSMATLTECPSPSSELDDLYALKPWLVEAAFEIWLDQSYLFFLGAVYDFVRLSIDGSISQIHESHIQSLIELFRSRLGELVEDLAKTRETVKFIAANFQEWEKTQSDVTTGENSKLAQELIEYIDDETNGGCRRCMQWALTYISIDPITTAKNCHDIRSIEAEFHNHSQAIEKFVADSLELVTTYENGLSSLAIESSKNGPTPAAVLHDVFEGMRIFRVGNELEDLLSGAWYILPLYPSLDVTSETGEPTTNRYLTDPVLFDPEEDENYIGASVSFVSADFHCLASRLALPPRLHPLHVDTASNCLITATSPRSPSLQLEFSMDFDP